MKAAGVLILAVAAVAASPPAPEMRYFHFERPVQNVQQAGQTCVAIDPAIFSHAQAGLADLRLYRLGSAAIETPYALRDAAPASTVEGSLELLNKGLRGERTAFDVAMPDGPYSDLDVAVSEHNFIATVTVDGSQTQGGAATALGAFTIFDLSRQRLGRSTVLHLPRSDFRFLHFSIDGPIKPDFVTGLNVVRLPESEPRYIAVAQTAQASRVAHDSVFTFTVTAHTPVERVAFAVGQQPVQFSRGVRVEVEPVSKPDAPRNHQTAYGSGSLLRVHSVENGHRIDEERLTVNAPPGNSTDADFDAPTRWTVTVDNGDDVPLGIDSVKLEMFERDVCFDAAAGAQYALSYGDPALVTPQYDYAGLFAPARDAVQAAAGPEVANAGYEARADQRPFTERHPALLWVALVVAIAGLGLVALRSVKRVE